MLSCAHRAPTPGISIITHPKDRPRHERLGHWGGDLSGDSRRSRAPIAPSRALPLHCRRSVVPHDQPVRLHPYNEHNVMYECKRTPTQHEHSTSDTAQWGGDSLQLQPLRQRRRSTVANLVVIPPVRNERPTYECSLAHSIARSRHKRHGTVVGNLRQVIQPCALLQPLRERCRFTVADLVLQNQDNTKMRATNTTGMSASAP